MLTFDAAHHLQVIRSKTDLLPGCRLRISDASSAAKVAPGCRWGDRWQRTGQD